jgi:hypothetical protein
MQGRRATILTTLAVLLAFAGCNNSQPTVQPAPAPTPTPATTPVVNPVLDVLQTDTDTKKDEVRTASLTPGSSVVTWTSTSAFNVQFDSADTNPCDISTAYSRSVPFIYNSQEVGSTTKYTVTCTIASKSPAQKPPYRYKVKPGQYSPGGSRTGSHCEGCVMEVDGW